MYNNIYISRNAHLNIVLLAAIVKLIAQFFIFLLLLLCVRVAKNVERTNVFFELFFRHNRIRVDVKSRDLDTIHVRECHRKNRAIVINCVFAKRIYERLRGRRRPRGTFSISRATWVRECFIYLLLNT